MWKKGDRRQRDVLTEEMIERVREENRWSIRGIYRNMDKQRPAQRRWRHGLTEEMIERVREENRWIFSNTDEQKDYDNDRE